MDGVIRFPLETPRLVIRPMELADAEQLLAVYGDRETMRHLESELPATVAEARAWVQAKVDLFARDDGLSLWTVVERSSGRVAGDVGLQWEDYGWGAPVVGIGGRGNKAFWRNGFGLEAALAVLDAGFAQLGLDRIGAETAPANLPAQGLLRRLGMTRRGQNPDGWPVFVISRAEWAARRGAGESGAGGDVVEGEG